MIDESKLNKDIEEKAKKAAVSLYIVVNKLRLDYDDLISYTKEQPLGLIYWKPFENYTWETMRGLIQTEKQRIETIIKSFVFESIF